MTCTPSVELSYKIHLLVRSGITIQPYVESQQDFIKSRFHTVQSDKNTVTAENVIYGEVLLLLPINHTL